tara:strand:+ start:1611 stop:1901 length:291 start_codon:yes stop_codon:yes gene_type:complete
MPQLILSSEIKGEFPSFVIDIDQEQLKHLNWMDVLEIISIKFKIPTKRLYVKTTNGKRVSKKNLNEITFNIDNYRMQYTNSKVKNNDYWFSFGTKI